MPSYENLVEEAQAQLREFGVEEVPGHLVPRGESIWLTTASDWPEGVRIHAFGVRLFRVQRQGLKPTSFGLMVLGPHITHRRVELTREELRELLLGRVLTKENLPEGYVALCLESEVLGCGEVRNGLLRSHIPRARRQELLVVLAHEGKLRAPEARYNGPKGERMETVEDVLKGAILLEERGRAFYAHAAGEARSPGLKEVFALLAAEEEKHKQYLARLLSEYLRTGQIEASGTPVDVSSAVLTPEVRAAVEAAEYEAAAIYAGMALEEKAVAFYTEKAKQASSELAAVYQALARWEQTHLDLLTALDEELRKKIWFERSFWPLD